MKTSQLSHLPSVKSVRDQILELIDGCEISPEDSILTLQTYLSAQDWTALELTQADRTGSIYDLSIGEFLDEETWELD